MVEPVWKEPDRFRRRRLALQQPLNLYSRHGGDQHPLIGFVDEGPGALTAEEAEAEIEPIMRTHYGNRQVIHRFAVDAAGLALPAEPALLGRATGASSTPTVSG